MSILSSDWFKINGISSDTIGVYVNTPNVPPMAQRRYTEYSTGWDEDETTLEDTWENIPYFLTFYTFFSENFDNSDIYALFAEPKTLEISRFPNKYFKIRTFNMETPAFDADGNKIIYTAAFSLAPFKYSTDNDFETLKSGDIISNNGSIYSRPTIVISGSGDVEISVNGDTFKINGLEPSKEVTIDSARTITYTGDTLINTQTSGNYPMLNTGDNQITFGGNVVNAKIRKNVRWR